MPLITEKQTHTHRYTRTAIEDHTCEEITKPLEILHFFHNSANNLNQKCQSLVLFVFCFFLCFGRYTLVRQIKCMKVIMLICFHVLFGVAHRKNINSNLSKSLYRSINGLKNEAHFAVITCCFFFFYLLVLIMCIKFISDGQFVPYL